MTHTLVLLRHGESEWNAKNLFTGWVDVDLTDEGRGRGRPRRRAAARGGPAARRRAHLAAAPRDQHRRASRSTPPTGTGSRSRRSWRLNERHYGALQGKDKKQTLEQYGEEQFMLWRRSFDVPPPPLDDDDEFSQVGRPPLRRPRRRDAAHRVPQGRHRPDAALLGVRRSSPTCAPARPSWSPPTATACARSSSTSTGSATRTSPGSTSRPACRWSTSSTTTCAPPCRVASTSTRRRPPPLPPRSPTRAADPSRLDPVGRLLPGAHRFVRDELHSRLRSELFGASCPGRGGRPRTGAVGQTCSVRGF